MAYEDGVLFLNPGSAGPHRFDLPASLARLRVDPSGRLVARLIDLSFKLLSLSGYRAASRTGPQVPMALFVCQSNGPIRQLKTLLFF
jgi:hypothetical protein